MKYKLILLLFLYTPVLFSQSVAEGDKLFNAKHYLKARAVYAGLLKNKPNDGLYNYRFAYCSYELKDTENAITHFEKAGVKFPLCNLYLGELYFSAYRFEESVSAYQNYITTLKSDDSKVNVYKERIKKAENGARLMGRIEDIAIIDSLVVDKDNFLRFYKFNKELGTLSQDQLTLNGTKTDKIKYLTQRGDRVYYSDSIKGSMNLFTSYKLLDAWSPPTSISDMINTTANENYPFLLADGVTIYFASDGDNSIGGYDLFITRYNPSTDTYLAPENIGMPFNSPFNDYMMVIDEQRKMGWFATDRHQPQGKVAIYTFIPNDVKTILHSDDKDYLRRAAQLKTYRKVAESIPDSTEANENQSLVSGHQIEFVVNDSTIYTNANQFKSEDAITGWNDLHKITTELNTKVKELSDLRGVYAQTENAQERTALAPKILELEKNNMTMKQQILMKTLQVRNSENKYLQKKSTSKP